MCDCYNRHPFGLSQLGRACFDYEISADHILQITDLDQGPSVTNDIENVLADIIDAEQLTTLSGYQVIYRDSLRCWDRVLIDEAGHFRGFAPLGGIIDQDEALRRVRAGWGCVSNRTKNYAEQLKANNQLPKPSGKLLASPGAANCRSRRGYPASRDGPKTPCISIGCSLSVILCLCHGLTCRSQQ